MLPFEEAIWENKYMFAFANIYNKKYWKHIQKERDREWAKWGQE